MGETVMQETGFWDDKTGLIKNLMNDASGPGARGVFVVLIASDILKAAVASRALVDAGGAGAGQHLRFAFSELCAEVSNWLTNFEEQAEKARKKHPISPGTTESKSGG